MFFKKKKKKNRNIASITEFDFKRLKKMPTSKYINWNEVTAYNRSLYSWLSFG